MAAQKAVVAIRRAERLVRVAAEQGDEEKVRAHDDRAGRRTADGNSDDASA